MPLQARVNEQGRVVIPRQVREALGIKANSVIQFEITDHQARVTVVDIRKALNDVREKLKADLPGVGKEIVNELLTDRRREAKRE